MSVELMSVELMFMSALVMSAALVSANIHAVVKSGIFQCSSLRRLLSPSNLHFTNFLYKVLRRPVYALVGQSIEAIHKLVIFF